MSSMKKRTVILFVVFSFLFVVFLLLIVGSFFLLSGDSQKLENERNILEYQFYQINPKTNESSVGFVTLFENEIGEDGYQYSVGADGSHTLISEFGSNEYMCTGSCFCGEEKSFRRTTNIMSGRALLYLLAAASTYLAYKLAGDHFEKECRQKLSNTCDMKEIRSEIDSCEHVKSSKEYSDDPEVKKFWCKGECKFFCRFGEHIRNEFLRTGFNCDGEVLRSEFFVTPEEVEAIHGGSGESAFSLTAKESFFQEYLKPYCNMLGEMKLKEFKMKLEEFFSPRKDNPFTQDVCMGDEEKVRCLQVIPR